MHTGQPATWHWAAQMRMILIRLLSLFPWGPYPASVITGLMYTTYNNPLQGLIIQPLGWGSSGGGFINRPSPVSPYIGFGSRWSTQFIRYIIRHKGTTVKHSLIPMCHKQPPCYNLPPRRRATVCIYRCAVCVIPRGTPRAMRMILICIRVGARLDHAVIS